MHRIIYSFQEKWYFINIKYDYFIQNPKTVFLNFHKWIYSFSKT